MRHPNLDWLEMEKKPEISVIIPTYNRASMLTSAIESVLRQDCGRVNYDVVVVDNNSDDDTRNVIESFVSRGEPVRYLFEKNQGVSNARNCGINNTYSDILAFLDDDVIAQRDWISKIKQSFEQHPDILFVGGKVLPQWKVDPPSWLTPEHWSPLALVDYGDEEFFVDWNRQVCLVTANLGVRRRAFERYGPFLTDLERCEDHEFESRIFIGGDRGIYDPELVVIADVQNERLKKNYHRVWWSGRGRALARFRAYETSPLSGIPDGSPSSTFRIFGVTSDVYKELFRNLIGWTAAVVRRENSKAFYFESHARDALNYIYESYRMSLFWRDRGQHVEEEVVADTESRITRKQE